MATDTFMPDVSKDERRGHLFGFPIAHSLSPLLHQTVFDGLGLHWSYDRIESTDMELFLKSIRHPQFYGAAVTMPHKVAILKYLDGLTPEAASVGAVNTIFLQHDAKGERKYIGTNTDITGIRDAFAYNVDARKYEGRPALVIGGGGAARSAIYALRTWMKASSIYLVNRDAEEVQVVIEECKKQGFGDSLIHVATVAQAEQLEGVGAIVACVPDFAPKTEQEKEARRVFECFVMRKPHKGAILEMCYHPSIWTQIADISQSAGWQVILGTEALIYQGLEQDRYWTGKPMSDLPVDKVKHAIAAKVNEAKL